MAVAATRDLEAVGSCPTRDAVATALAPVLAREGGRIGASPVSSPPRVVDLGDHFEVTAAGQRAQYSDAARDCAERARIAAVFIGLALNPPVFQPPPPLPPPLPPPAPQPPVPPSAAAAPLVTAQPPPQAAPDASPAPTWLAFGISGRVDAATAGRAPSTTTVVAGGDLRGAIGRRWLGLVATAGVLAPTTSRYSAVPVRQQRFPLSLGLTVVKGVAGGIQIGGDLAVALSPFTVRGEGLVEASSELRLDVGARAALAVGVTNLVKRSVLFAEIHAEVYPRPYNLNVEPLGGIGITSKLWLGAAAGVWFGGP
jgi:hypothetical protein